MRTLLRCLAAGAAGLLLSLPAGAARDRSDSDMAVLIMANGGGTQWTKSIRKMVKAANIPYPHSVYFGIGDTPAGQRELQSAIADLEAEGVNTIYVVPLLTSSYSEVARQWRYLLGLDVQAGFMNIPLFPVQKRSTIRWMDPLNDSTVVVEILLDRARDISANPSKETIIIVAPGPNDNTDNERWQQILKSLASRLRDRGGFENAEGVSLREDAPAAVRQQAIQNLRDRVKAADQAGSRVLVIPLLLSPGGIEHKISLELRGFNYAFNAKTLLPDNRISEWIRSQVP